MFTNYRMIKICERLYKFISKKVIATQKFNSQSSLQSCDFNFCVAITFLSMNLCIRLHNLQLPCESLHGYTCSLIKSITKIIV
jgi:hypothetical protein